ncbi:dienelactone hydrolase family protein [Lysobacter humi (ex Lee et al. 2017)]
MHDWTLLETPHGAVRAWRADPVAPPRGAVVLVQEIFGVNAHIRDVAARFAGAGWAVLAPSVCDPVEAAVELDYDDAGVARGRELVAALGFDRAVDIVGAAAGALGAEGQRVAVVGFCWGGSVAYLANARLGLPAVSYYGGRTVPYLDEPPRAPLLLHFGERDPIIPPEHVALHRARLPGAEIHVYPAGHGFNCDRRADYDADSAAIAWARTLAFLDEVSA